jgi:hypothetical protein
MNLDRIAPALDLTLPPCLSNSAPEQVDYSFEAIEYPGDSFTQLLGINNGGSIAGYHGVKANKGFIYDLSTKTFTDKNFPGAAQTRVTGINNLDVRLLCYDEREDAGFTAKAESIHW